ncbi:hypothetical protein TWF225_000820 [Orbilia oligospora]|nr:hypothetical protein TWF225_000820 [Orbilia oligospora]KAF3250356.1 hypothetical protein TWF128_007513 [Orbilia oligospora]KAF3263714.1 hypothetical protein TWF217_003427 [Orbilia oligospora]KAF3285772.1 hypothetical protein TWF132_009134 [Orbilia oligospora]
MSTTDPFVLAWNSIRYHTSNMMDQADKHFDSMATTIRQKANDTSWLPQFPHRKSPPPPPPVAPVIIRDNGKGLGVVWTWVKEHKWLVAGLMVVVVGGGVLVVKRKRQRVRRRKALKAANGARKEVVVIHGQPHDPIVKSTAHDLERRGFVVYIAVSSHEDEQVVLAEGKTDIKPLQIDILDTLSARASISRFSSYLKSPVVPFQGAPPHHLKFTALILIPDSNFPSGPIETIPLDHWSDTFNLKIIQTLAITQLFLPIVTESRARVLFVTPGIGYSLRLPFHAPEVAAVGALEGVIGCLRREVSPAGVQVGWIKVGTLDLGTTTEKKGNKESATRADVLSWSPAVRSIYARGYVCSKAVGDGVRGSSLKEVNAAIVAGMLDKRVKKIMRVGSGSVAYDFIGRWVPEGVVGWMLGLRGGRRVTENVRGISPGSRGSSSHSLESSVEWERVDK